MGACMNYLLIDRLLILPSLSSAGVCPEGEKAYVNAADMSVRECLINVDGSCPASYLCRFNAQKNRYYWSIHNKMTENTFYYNYFAFSAALPSPAVC
jgi:hypothetical protein